MAFEILNEADAFNKDQSELDNVDIDVLVAAYNRTGIWKGLAVTEDSPASLTVEVTAGLVIINDVVVAVLSGSVTSGAADGTNPRFDLVTVDTTGALAIVAGNAAASPVFPEVPANEVLLAALYIPSSDTTIATNQITDKRVVIPFIRNPRRKQHDMLMRDATTTLTSLGMSNLNIGTVTEAHDGDGRYINHVSAASDGSRAGISSANFITRREWSPIFRIRGTFLEITSTRMIIGYGDIAFDNHVNNDDPTGLTVLLQFRAGTDTNWQLITDNGTLTRTDTGVAPDTNIHNYTIGIDSANGRAWVFIDEGTVIVTATTLPTASTDFKVFAGCETAEATAKTFRWNFIWVEDEG